MKKLLMLLTFALITFSLIACESQSKPAIYGGPSGWEVTKFLENKFENEEDYPYLAEDFEFRPLESTSTLNAVLMDAYENEEPWIGYNWEPTWIMGQLDMVLLEDELEYDNETGRGNPPSQDVKIVANADFSSEFPEVADFLSNYETSSQITSEGLAYMQENEASSEETAMWWLEEEQDLWTPWVPEEVENHVLDVINGTGDGASEIDETINIGEGDWESNEFHDAVASIIIEKGYGYETEIFSVDTSVLMQSLTNGDLHLSMEIWTDNTPSYFDGIEDGTLEDLSVNFDDNYQGIYIPKYLQEEHPGLQSIQDLPDYEHIFEPVDE